MSNHFTTADYERLHASIEASSKSGDPSVLPFRSVTIPNAEVPIVLLALEIAAEVATSMEDEDEGIREAERRQT